MAALISHFLKAWILFINMKTTVLTIDSSSGVLGLGRSHAKVGEYAFMNMESCGYVSPQDKVSGPVRAPQQRIIKGDLAQIGEFPWQASILHNKKPSKHNYLCGAVLIHKYWVLTAKHCIEPYVAIKLSCAKHGLYFHRRRQAAIQPAVLIVTMGTVDTFDLPPGYTFNVTHYVKAVDADLALLHLEKPVQPERNDYEQYYRVNYICLPKESILNYDDEDAIVSGFGDFVKNKGTGPYEVNYKLRKATLLINPVDFCSDKNLKHPLDSTFICSTSSEQIMTCFGDSGSGLVQVDGKRAVLIGIVLGDTGEIYGTHLCDQDVMKFQRVSKFIEFIEKTIVFDKGPIVQATSQPGSPSDNMLSTRDPDRDYELPSKGGSISLTKLNFIDIIISTISMTISCFAIISG